MPDKHKMKLFHFSKTNTEEDNLTPSNSNQSHSSVKKFLGLHLGKNESGESLHSPSLSHNNNNDPEIQNPQPYHPMPELGQIVQPQVQQIQVQSRSNTSSPHTHSPSHSISKEDSNHAFLKSNSMVELKKFFKPIKRGPLGKKPDYDNKLHSPPPIAGSQQQQQQQQQHVQSGNISHNREQSSTSLAALINQTSSQLLQHASHNTNNPDSKPPFTDDASPLVQKYGKIGKEIGSGAGGSVKLIIRPSDSKTFAVKEFRPRRNTESLRDYTRKCTAEYCIGSTLKHPNIIKTIDIIHENNRYYEIMEFAPIDFFAVVMSGQMTRQEINCCFKQILEGVQYLHGLGLAHRDLKLDNCVLTMDGILKIIDFGSAVIFRYPYDQYGNSKNSAHYCHGVVGSDPYLAPEVLKNSNSYNPQPVDLWSIAIIYCCMTLKRFPWKIPDTAKDDGFRLYCMEDDGWHDYNISNECHKLLLHQRKLKNMIVRLNKKKKAIESEEDNMEQDHEPTDAEAQQQTPEAQAESEDEILSDEKHQQIVNELKKIEDKLASFELTKQEMKQKFTQVKKPEPPVEDELAPKKKNHKQIHGPYRLMRLLPHASRPIISKMLQVDPHKRATIEDIYNDEWVKDITCCTLTKIVKSDENLQAGVNFEEDEEDVLVKGSPPHKHTVVLSED